MREAAQFPGAEVSCQENHSFAAFDCALVVLEAFIQDVLGDVVFVEIGEMAELNEQAAKAGKRTAKDGVAFLIAEVGHRHLQIPHSGPPLPAREPKPQRGDDLRSGIGGKTGKPSERFQQRYCSGVFDGASNAFSGLHSPSLAFSQWCDIFAYFNPFLRRGLCATCDAWNFNVLPNPCCCFSSREFAMRSSFKAFQASV